MSHLPPPPPNAAPYAPPPPQYGQPYHPYAAQPGYGQQPPPPPPGHQNGYGQHRPSPPNNHHQNTGHDRQGKSKMVVTRYPRPPNRHQPYSGGPGPYAHQAPPPPPGVAPYSQAQPGWSQSAHAQPPAAYPPPPNSYPQAPPPPHQYPAAPPPQQAPFHAYAQQPHAAYPPPPPAQAYPPPPNQAYPPPPSQANPYAPPPPPGGPAAPWSAPAPAYPPPVAYSPVPSVASYQAPAAPSTPAQNVASIPPPQATPGPPTIIKDRSDPTFYDGWDDGEFEYGGALWIPPKGDSSHDHLSLGQYIWRAAEQVTRAASLKVDEPMEVATLEQKYDPAHFVIASKYYDTEDAEGHEYIHSFQRIRQLDEWKEKKDDPLYTTFTPKELHERVYTHKEIFEQCLQRPKEESIDMAAYLNENLTAYFKGTKGGSGKNLEAENLLASLGVTGSAKPVFATPFPAYNPPPGESPAPQSATPATVAKPPTPAPRAGGFNPFKVSGGLSRQPTPRVGSTPQPTFTRPQQPTPHASPSRRSPSDAPPPKPEAGQLPLPPPPPPPPPPAHSAGYKDTRPPRGPRTHDIGHHSDNQKYRSPRDDHRTPDMSPRDGPWTVSKGYREATPGTPAGSDFGDYHANPLPPGKDSATGTPRDHQGQHDNRKRKHHEADHAQRKRNQPKPASDSAYGRRW